MAISQCHKLKLYYLRHHNVTCILFTLRDFFTGICLLFFRNKTASNVRLTADNFETMLFFKQDGKVIESLAKSKLLTLISNCTDKILQLDTMKLIKV